MALGVMSSRSTTLKGTGYSKHFISANYILSFPVLRSDCRPGPVLQLRKWDLNGGILTYQGLLQRQPKLYVTAILR